jgi:hypothetical protein
VIFGIGPYCITKELITDLIQLPKQTLLQPLKDGIIEHIDMIVLISFAELVGGSPRINPGHDSRSNDGHIKPV